MAESGLFNFLNAQVIVIIIEKIIRAIAIRSKIGELRTCMATNDIAARHNKIINIVEYDLIFNSQYLIISMI